MKDNGQRRITVSVRLTPTDIAVLRAEAARRIQAGARFDYSALVREALHQQPWFQPSPAGGDET